MTALDLSGGFGGWWRSGSCDAVMHRIGVARDGEVPMEHVQPATMTEALPFDISRQSEKPQYSLDLITIQL